MRNREKVLLFSCASEFSDMKGHSVESGGLPMEIKHMHPEYESDEARLERIKNVRMLCIQQISERGKVALKQNVRPA